MAGSINLSLSQQFDKLNGNLLSGGRLYFYAAGTDAPQNAYKDTGLTLVHPNPIILASDGRVPQLYFADGSIHVRLTDNGGVVQFDEDFILVVGPSDGGGGGGGGSTVDPNAIFQTGWMDWQPIIGTRSGWVRCNGRTIGSASSGATERANADCQALFEFKWNTYNNTYCPVSGGRGANALADWGANKTIGTLDFREITIGGLADMGSTVLGTLAGVPVERDNAITAAGIIGANQHALTTAQMPAHAHNGTTGTNDVGHNHAGGDLFDAVATQNIGGGGTATVVTAVNASGSGNTASESTPHSHGFATDSQGGGTVHNNMPRTIVGTFYMRL